MVSMRVEDKPAFKVTGKKVWIPGPFDNGVFGQFYGQCHTDGTIGKLMGLHIGLDESITKSPILGVSRVEKDPTDRSFFFYVATESPLDPEDGALESFEIPSGKWAIFSNRGDLPDALVEAEMTAFRDWLPASPYIHAPAPEIEAYPAGVAEGEGTYCEFWLPITDRT